MTSARRCLPHLFTYHLRVGRFMEVDAAHALCPDCPTTAPVASQTVEEQQEKADTDTRLHSSRLPARAAAAAVADSPSLAPIREAVGGTTGSQTSLGKKERPADKGRRLGSKTGSSSNYGWKRGNPSIQDSSPVLSGAGAASALEADEWDQRTGAKKNRGLIGGQETIGRAAAMADLYEYRGGKGGALQWLKDRLSNTITSNKSPGDGRGAMDWEGMD